MELNHPTQFFFQRKRKAGHNNRVTAASIFHFTLASRIVPTESLLIGDSVLIIRYLV
jgi:hypothetical protein